MQVGICPVALKIPVDEVKPLVRVKKIFLRWCSARRSFLGAGCAGAEGVHGPRIPDAVTIMGGAEAGVPCDVDESPRVR